MLRSQSDVQSSCKSYLNKASITIQPSHACNVLNCKKSAARNNLCTRHFLAKRKRSDSLETIAVINSRSKTNAHLQYTLCSVIQCEKPTATSGLCTKHYAERFLHEFNEIIKPQDKTKQNKSQYMCSVENCDKWSQRNGLCLLHLQEKNSTTNRKTKTKTMTKSGRVSMNSTIQILNINSNNSSNVNIHELNQEIQNIMTYSQNACPPRRSTKRNSKQNLQSEQSSTIDVQSKDQNEEIDINRCQYTISMNNHNKCSNLATYKCYHCLSSFCLEHDLQHQEDIEEEMTCILDEAKTLITEIPSINIESGRKNCAEQLKHWFDMTLNQVQQKYYQLQNQLDQIHNDIETNKDRWKQSLISRLETNLTSVLTIQLQTEKIDGIEINKAKDELVRLQKLCDLLNNQTLITISNIDDNNELNFPLPHLIFPSIDIEGFNWTDIFSIEKKEDKTNQSSNYFDELLEAMIDIDGHQLINSTRHDTHPIDFIGQFGENNMQQSYTETNGVFSTICVSQCPKISHEQIIARLEDCEKLDLSSQNLICSDVQIISSILHNNMILTTLILSRNQIKDDGVKFLSNALQNNQTITTLDLSQNQIGDDGARALSNTLKTNITLTSLNLSQNQIGTQGGQCFIDALQSNQTLTTLNLTFNPLSNEILCDLTLALTINSSKKSIHKSSNTQNLASTSLSSTSSFWDSLFL